MKTAIMEKPVWEVTRKQNIMGYTGQTICTKTVILLDRSFEINILMEDEKTLKYEDSVRQDYVSGDEPCSFNEGFYCTLEGLGLVEEQRREFRNQIGFQGCNLSDEDIWG